MRIARWESRSGRWWLELTRHENGTYSYAASGMGGYLGALMSDVDAVAVAESKLWARAAGCEHVADAACGLREGSMRAFMSGLTRLPISETADPRHGHSVRTRDAELALAEALAAFAAEGE